MSVRYIHCLLWASHVSPPRLEHSRSSARRWLPYSTRLGRRKAVAPRLRGVLGCGGARLPRRRPRRCPCRGPARPEKPGQGRFSNLRRGGCARRHALGGAMARSRSTWLGRERRSEVGFEADCATRSRSGARRPKRQGVIARRSWQIQDPNARLRGPTPDPSHSSGAAATAWQLRSPARRTRSAGACGAVPPSLG
jgi:hypothetical protein